jgi:hypothetical protein
MDHHQNLGSLSIYHLNTDLYHKIKERTEIHVYCPIIKSVKFNSSPEEVDQK